MAGSLRPFSVQSRERFCSATVAVLLFDAAVVTLRFPRVKQDEFFFFQFQNITSRFKILEKPPFCLQHQSAKMCRIPINIHTKDIPRLDSYGLLFSHSINPTEQWEEGIS